MRNERGFSLVELTVVLIILGFMVAGVLVGQRMIRSSEVQSVMTEVNRFVSAAQTFRDRYQSLPGDMPDATAQWGAADADPDACRFVASNTTATCNGNGDGLVGTFTSMGAYDTSYERHRFWQHLVNARLIEGGHLSGNIVGMDQTHSVIGTNVPGSAVKGGGYTFLYYNDAVVGAGNSYALDNPAHAFLFGMESASWETHAGILTGEEAYEIDNKMDDGKPSSGTVQGWLNTSAVNPECTSSDNAATAEYVLKEGGMCSLIFLTGL